VLICPVLLENKLAETSALFPQLQIEMKLKGLGKILGTNQYKKVKNMLLYLHFAEIPEWMKFIIGENLERLIPKLGKPGIEAELQFIGTILKLERSQADLILKKLYSDHNLKEMIETGFKLFKLLSFSFFPDSPVLITKRKRGYSDKGSTSSESDKRRKISMNEINREVEEIKQRVLKKQLQIFEKNLDRILEIENSDFSRNEIKKIVKNQNVEIQNIQHPEEEKENDE